MPHGLSARARSKSDTGRSRVMSELTEREALPGPLAGDVQEQRPLFRIAAARKLGVPWQGHGPPPCAQLFRSTPLALPRLPLRRVQHGRCYDLASDVPVTEPGLKPQDKPSRSPSSPTIHGGIRAALS